MKYFKPTSLTFWMGVLPLVQGLILLTTPLHNVTAAAEIVRLMTDAQPMALINTGLALVGLRAAPGVSQALERNGL
jgi:hypothetical protein